jgi:hypothetical protein
VPTFVCKIGGDAHISSISRLPSKVKSIVLEPPWGFMLKTEVLHSSAGSSWMLWKFSSF